MSNSTHESPTLKRKTSRTESGPHKRQRAVQGTNSVLSQQVSPDGDHPLFHNSSRASSSRDGLSSDIRTTFIPKEDGQEQRQASQSGYSKEATSHPTTFAYTGNYRGALWNAQGLFASKACQQQKKFGELIRLMIGRDFIFISEAHSNAEKAKVKKRYLQQAGLVAFWSHGTNARAGIGIVVRQTFLDQFDKNPAWDQVSKGEAGILRLKGPNGNLDLASCYFPTGNEAEEASLPLLRIALQQKVFDSIRDQKSVLTLLGGDFNYVTTNEDRWSKEAGKWSGDKDHRETEHFGKKGTEDKHLMEVHQPHATHDSSIARSRLDRLYTSQHACDQFDMDLGCATGEWNKKLSNHRPLVFFRRRRQKEKTQKGERASLPTGPMHHPDWVRHVHTAYRDDLLCKTNPEDATVQLFTLKEAISRVTTLMDEQASRTKMCEEVTEVDDKLGWTMRCIRAGEKGYWNIIRKACRAYPRLNDFFGDRELADSIAADGKSASGTQIQALKSHAVELQRISILDEIKDIQREAAEVGEDGTANRRSKVQSRLKNLRPGNCGAIAAVRCQDGSIAITQEDIAQELRRHWKEVFSERPIDFAKLREWFKEDLPVDGLPRWSEGDLDLLRKDIEDAIKRSPNSMPGPDGIPYIAWRKLGRLGSDILFKTVQAMGEDNFHNLLQKNDPAAYGDQHTFNMGHMVFLPKKIAGVHPL